MPRAAELTAEKLGFFQGNRSRAAADVLQETILLHRTNSKCAPKLEAIVNCFVTCRLLTLGGGQPDRQARKLLPSRAAAAIAVVADEQRSRNLEASLTDPALVETICQPLTHLPDRR